MKLLPEGEPGGGGLGGGALFGAGEGLAETVLGVAAVLFADPAVASAGLAAFTVGEFGAAGVLAESTDDCGEGEESEVEESVLCVVEFEAAVPVVAISVPDVVASVVLWANACVSGDRTNDISKAPTKVVSVHFLLLPPLCKEKRFT